LDDKGSGSLDVVGDDWLPDAKSVFEVMDSGAFDVLVKRCDGWC
jgi:hypothetical protein